MKTKGACLFLLLLLFCGSLMLSAAADVIVEPEDLFYKTHRDECVYNGYRCYVINSETGYAYLYKNPKSDMTVKGLSNGETVTLRYLYTDQKGEQWGCVNMGDGWCRMAEVSLVYDSVAFMEAHGAAVVDHVDGSYPVVGSESQPVVIWSYPGGAVQQRLTWDLTDSVTRTYTDDRGNVWGYIPYERGMRDLWVCLNDPYSQDVGGYAVEEHRVVLKAAPVAQEDIPVGRGNVVAYTVAAVLIVLILLGSGAAIWLLYGKRKAATSKE